MMESVALYARYVSLSFRSQLQYRGSFALNAIGGFFANFSEFVGMWILFSRFSTLGGWTLGEVALFYGMISVSFSLALAFARGLDTFSLQITSGDFDRLLLRPRTTFFQVLAHDFQLVRVGRLTQGLLVLIWALVNLRMHWDVYRAVLLTASVAGGTAMFTGLFVLQATMCFWSTQTLEALNTFTDGGVETAKWPMSIYEGWFLKFFIYVIPLACVNYFPVLAILGKPDPLHFPSWLGWVSPLAGFIFLAASLLVWRSGVRHYRSAGS
jgi:ABC-2 type transport system permease protein